MIQNQVIDKDSELIEYFKLKYKLKIEKACFSTGRIPEYIILDRTRNIHSYCFFIYQNEFTFFDKSIFNKLIELSKIRYSNLDRPLFVFLISTDYDVKFFEINEFKELIFNDTISNESLNKLWIDFDTMSTLIKSEL